VIKGSEAFTRKLHARGLEHSHNRSCVIAQGGGLVDHHRDFDTMALLVYSAAKKGCPTRCGRVLLSCRGMTSFRRPIAKPPESASRPPRWPARDRLPGLWK
jgi:hypothetical protein